MKKISIPYHHQKPGSVDCGPVCVQMILEYFGFNVTLKELKENSIYSKVGTFAYDNGSLMLKKGLQVTAVTAHPMLFPPDKTKGVKKSELPNYLDTRTKLFPKHKKGILSLQNFIGAGGNLTIAVPTEKHIKQAINSGALVLALLYGGALGDPEGGFHFVVVSGYKKGAVYINNPLYDSTRQAWFPIDQFLYALHTSTCADIDNGTLLIVNK